MQNTYFYKNYQTLKNRLFLVFCYFIFNLFIGYLYCNESIYILIKPLLKINNMEYLIITEMTELFFLQLLVSLFFSIFFSFWFLLSQLSIYFFDGGFKTENLKIAGWLLLLLLNLILNNFIIFNYIIPSVLNFFISTEKIITINEGSPLIFFEPKLSNYVILTIKSIVFSNFFLQYPSILLYLFLFNFLKTEIINTYRKIFYLKIWILSTFITPPDIFTSLILSIFLCLILEIMLYITIYCKNLKKKKIIHLINIIKTTSFNYTLNN